VRFGRRVGRAGCRGSRDSECLRQPRRRTGSIYLDHLVDRRRGPRRLSIGFIVGGVAAVGQAVVGRAHGAWWAGGHRRPDRPDSVVCASEHIRLHGLPHEPSRELDAAPLGSSLRNADSPPVVPATLGRVRDPAAAAHIRIGPLRQFRPVAEHARVSDHDLVDREATRRLRADSDIQWRVRRILADGRLAGVEYAE
jgi:hypothetical protein